MQVTKAWYFKAIPFLEDWLLFRHGSKLIGACSLTGNPKTFSLLIHQIEFLGGHCHFCQSSDIYGSAAKLAHELTGHYMDQFTYAERATDWRGNNNIAESLFRQMARERHPIPQWVVMSAGTGLARPLKPASIARLYCQIFEMAGPGGKSRPAPTVGL